MEKHRKKKITKEESEESENQFVSKQSPMVTQLGTLVDSP